MRPDLIMSTWLPKELQTLNLVSRLKLYEAQLPVLLKFLCKVGWSKSFRSGLIFSSPFVLTNSCSI
uniref:Uncharacterized protein n=1 Tax=Setaria italica TaxID=4555 RepID=K4AHR3_SETIT